MLEEIFLFILYIETRIIYILYADLQHFLQFSQIVPLY